jgi:hypothetical protein
MFSSLDARPHSYLRVWVEGAGRSDEFGIPAWLQRRAVEAETLPTPARLDAVARAVMEAERTGGRPVDAVHVELWRDVHDPETLRATSRKVVEHVRRDLR